MSRINIVIVTTNSTRFWSQQETKTKTRKSFKHSPDLKTFLYIIIKNDGVMIMFQRHGADLPLTGRLRRSVRTAVDNTMLSFSPAKNKMAFQPYQNYVE